MTYTVVKIGDEDKIIIVPTKYVKGNCVCKLPTEWKKLSVKEICSMDLTDDNSLLEYVKTLGKADTIAECLNMLAAETASTCAAASSGKSVCLPSTSKTRAPRLKKRHWLNDFVYSSEEEDLDLTPPMLMPSRQLTTQYGNLQKSFPSPDNGDLLRHLRRQEMQIKELKVAVRNNEKQLFMANTRLKYLCDAVKQLRQKPTEQPNTSYTAQLLNIPVTSLAEFKALEDRLKGETFAEEFARKMKAIEGRTIPENINRCMRAVFANHFGPIMNYNGTRGKTAFKDTKCRRIIQNAISSQSGNMDAPDIVYITSFREWLHGQRDRGVPRIRPRVKNVATEEMPTQQ